MKKNFFYLDNAKQIYLVNISFINKVNKIINRGIERYGFVRCDGHDCNLCCLGHKILEKNIFKHFDDHTFGVNIKIIIKYRKGYNGGHNLDYDLLMEDKNMNPYLLSDYMEIDGLLDDMAKTFFNSNYKTNIYPMQYKAFLNEFIHETMRYTETVLSDICDKIQLLK